MKPQEYAASSAQPEERIPVRTITTRQYQDTQVDVKLVLCSLWIAMLFVFAYVDIFGFLRAEVLNAALDGKMATTGFTINQGFLTFTLIYILLPALMVVLSLLLKPRVNRIINIVLSLLYIIAIIGSAIGETWVYYLLGSLIEVILLAAIARTAWKWPPPQNAPKPP
jgi:glucan phosphoethanolaminetransferase (alkaline phosphatase superfamily)